MATTGVLLLLAGHPLHSAVLIDGFTTYQNVSVSGPPPGFQFAFASIAAANALGGERDVYVERTSANSGTVAVEVAGAGSGIASYNSGIRTTGNGLIVWDGVDGNAVIAPTGLGGFDLTQNGANTAFRLSRTSDLGGSLKITVYQDATHVSEATVAVPADPSFTFALVDVPFLSFIPVGPSGGANFASIGALSMLFDGGSAGADMGVELFVAVPEVTAWPVAGLLLGAVVLGALRRRFRAFA